VGLSPGGRSAASDALKIETSITWYGQFRAPSESNSRSPLLSQTRRGGGRPAVSPCDGARAGLALTLAVAPLSLAAALRPSFRVAPFSAVLVLLIGGALCENPAISVVVRVLEVALGGATAAAVSMLVFPERAHKLGIEAASRILRDMASLLPAVLDAFTQSADLNGTRRRQDDLGRAVGAFDDLVAEARRERMVSFTRDVDPPPLSRTLLRLRHDFVILIRAAAEPLPDAVAERLAPPLARFGREGSHPARLRG
jgi:hypothetical protein